jgi:hypothetical protein
MQTDKQKLIVINEILGIPCDPEYLELLRGGLPKRQHSKALQAYASARAKHAEEVKSKRIKNAQEWLFATYEPIFDLLSNPDTRQSAKVKISFLLLLIYSNLIIRLHDMIASPQEQQEKYTIQKSKYIKSTQNVIRNHSKTILDIETTRSTFIALASESMVKSFEEILHILENNFNSEIESLTEQQIRLEYASKTRSTPYKGFRSILTPFIILFNSIDPIPKQIDQVEALVSLFIILGYDDSDVDLLGIIRQWHIDAEDAYVIPTTQKISRTLRKLKNHL